MPGHLFRQHDLAEVTYDQLKASIFADLEQTVCPDCRRILYYIAWSALCFNCDQYVLPPKFKVWRTVPFRLAGKL